MTSSSAELFPEKFALYFSTLNPLASKIYSDIQNVEENLKYSSKSLSYNEKCALVDKVLIHDVLTRHGEKKTTTTLPTSSSSSLIINSESKDEMLYNEKDSENEEYFKPIKFNDSALDQDHTTSLLLFSYPKKPEKYVFEENGFWIDEHSAPFSFCKTSQANSCLLGELVKNLPAEKVISQFPKIPITNDDKAKPSIPHTAPPKKVPKQKHSKKTKAPRFFGVNVMGFNDTKSTEKNESKTAITTQPVSIHEFHKIENDEAQSLSDHEETNEEILPKQKQNLDLIAELQAKLNKNNSNKKIFRVANAEPEIESKSEKVEVKLAETKPILIQPKSKITSPALTHLNKIHKPKAPPPPPPKRNPDSESSFGNETSSPGSNIKDNQDSEFVVDVSSPCRIATPKTGLDFLDNW